MTTTIPTDVLDEIRTKAADTDGNLRALDRIAAEYGLLLPELRALLQQQPTDPRRDRAGRSAAASGPPAPSGHTKRCSKCGQTKPLSEFYTATDRRDGHGSHCRACNNQRPPTEARLLRSRARHAAYAVLVEHHRGEFDRLLTVEYDRVCVEHDRLKAAAEARGQHDADLARLKPGPKRKDQDDVTQRLDVARCPSCHTHHDDAHVCPSCGDTTPERPEPVKPYVIRAWGIDHGYDVPARGPIPGHIRAAYDVAHAPAEAAS